MKILHTGDIHLGDLSGPTKDGRNLRREDTLRCMEEVVATASDIRPEITIIAGDLFNRSRVWADTALEDVNDALDRFLYPLCKESGHVVLLFGTDNHDNPRAFEVINKAATDIPNLHVITTPQVLNLITRQGPPVQIVAVPGFDKSRLRLFCPGADKELENRNATALVNDVILGLSTQLSHSIPSILTAHYTVSGTLGGNGSTFMAGQDIVITPATIDAAGVDLACLGHIHRPQRLVSNTPAFYCGCLNQLTFNDEGMQHGFYIHELDGDRNVTSTFIHTPEREHFTFRMGPHDVQLFNEHGELRDLPGGAFTDKIVRVRYSCTSEQEKALNRAELQKAIMAAGAFHVAEILPEEVEDLDARDDLTEHEGPTEALARWLDMNEVPEHRKVALLALAAPIIQAADDGRDADRHTGAFIPERIEVTNYRSYTAASFDFSPVHMAMVNGQNGVGKSSLFMDAIADCLYESSRSEDIGGWVRDGTKSGSITFTFSMGAQQYRVIRTRTRSGRGTLALHRYNTEAAAWEDESDTTMKLTQAKIERLLGMDCNTFCSIALIRQDAYGLFLEASSDRRMEVLSALLGLDIYTRMEELSRLKAKDIRREIAATKERITILNEQVEKKADLLEEENRLTSEIAEAEKRIAEYEAIIKEAEQQEALRQEVLERFKEKQRVASEYETDLTLKKLQKMDADNRLSWATKAAAGMEEAKIAVDTLELAKAHLEDFNDDVARYKELTAELAKLEDVVSTETCRVQTATAERDTAAVCLSKKAEVEAAAVELQQVTKDLADAQKRLDENQEAKLAYNTAQKHYQEFDSQFREERSRIESRIAAAEKACDQLQDSGCQTPGLATCKFLADAREAADTLPSLLEDRDALDAQHEELVQPFADAATAAEARVKATGNPAHDIAQLLLKQGPLQRKAKEAAEIAAAEAKIAALNARIEESERNGKEAMERIESLQAELEKLLPSINEVRRLNAVIVTKQSYVKALEECRVAAAKAESLSPMIEQMEGEIATLEARLETAKAEAEEARARVPEAGSTDVSLCQLSLSTLRSKATRCASDRGAIQAKLEQVAEAEEQTAKLRQTVASLASMLDDYATLTQAFGLDGIQYMIIRGVVPEIMRQSNDILASMTGGRMAVDIRTEKELKSTKQMVNSLEVWISSIQGTVRPYLSHSGGEKVKIALAVTLGLADVKARRAGVQLGMLFIDEPPFLDADGTEAYADALSNMASRNPSMRILAISHDPTMKARFSQNIIVSAGEDGSTVRMEL